MCPLSFFLAQGAIQGVRPQALYSIWILDVRPRTRLGDQNWRGEALVFASTNLVYIYIYVYSLRQKLCAGFTLKRYLFAAAYESKIKHHPY